MYKHAYFLALALDGLLQASSSPLSSLDNKHKLEKEISLELDFFISSSPKNDRAELKSSYMPY